jgi:glycosyltransferase involved in cell wall biosynthesis
MKILIASDHWFPDRRGGSSRVAADSARQLAERGHDITVLAPRHDGLPARREEAGVEVLRVLPRTLVPQTFSDPPLVAVRARALRGRSFDVLLAHQASLAAGLLAARLGTPLALFFHASVPRELRFARAQQPPLGFARAVGYVLEPPLVLYERLAVRRADGILILSEFSRSLLETDYPGHGARARKVPGAIDTEAFSPGPRERLRADLGLDEDTRLLLTVRRLEPRMGLETLLEAFALVRRESDAVLAVAGAGSLESELRTRARALGIESRVRFLGPVSDRQLLGLYRGADLFVLPTVAYEGFGMVTAEALACGTPVVGTPVGATPELLEALDARLVAAGADAPSLAEAIAEALVRTGPELRSSCRDYAVRRFSWTAAAPVWEAALEEIARSGA